MAILYDSCMWQFCMIFIICDRFSKNPTCSHNLNSFIHSALLAVSKEWITKVSAFRGV